MSCGHHESAKNLLSFIFLLLLFTPFIFLSCSTKNNTAKSRFWQSFTARYNTLIITSKSLENTLIKYFPNYITNLKNPNMTFENNFFTIFNLTSGP